MKNIAIIVPTLNKGGAERVAANMSLEFAKHYNVYTIVHDGSDIIYPYGGTLIDLQLPPSETKVGKMTTLLKRVMALRKIKKKYRIDVSISHLPPSNYANILSRRGDHVFTYLHSMQGVPKREKLFAILSDRLVCVSRWSMENVIRNYGVPQGKATAVYNFCDAQPPAVFEKYEKFTIVNMGRLSEPKGQWHLLRAMKLVTQQLGDRIHLVIIGEGEYRQALETLADRLGIRGIVTFTGFRADPMAELVKCDLFVFSSLWEGLPMALVEAGRCGLPIVSTDCDSGCREILAPDTQIDKKTDCIEYAGYGILVPVCKDGDMQQLEPTAQERILADAILQMYHDPQLRQAYAEKALRRSEDFYSNQIMAQWKTLIEQ